ncbi:MAG: hypothetical protein JXR63_03815 [Spirochaetales bacterium]|nr:hypothetical protein [Spirochaetales bacterium]
MKKLLILLTMTTILSCYQNTPFYGNLEEEMVIGYLYKGEVLYFSDGNVFFKDKSGKKIDIKAPRSAEGLKVPEIADGIFELGRDTNYEYCLFDFNDPNRQMQSFKSREEAEEKKGTMFSYPIFSPEIKRETAFPKFAPFKDSEELPLRPFTHSSLSYFLVYNQVRSKADLSQIGLLPFPAVDAVFHDGSWYILRVYDISRFIAVRTYKSEIYRFADELPFANGELLYEQDKPFQQIDIYENEILGLDCQANIVKTGIEI